MFDNTLKINDKLNHTTAHVLAAAIMQLFPNTKLGIGPTTNEGFFYDFEFEKPLSESELTKIEKQMKKIISSSLNVVEVTDDVSNYKEQPYKKELINDITKKNEKVSFYSLQDPTNKKNIFIDLCIGNHIENTKAIKHFKLLSIAGAYWKGDSNNNQLTRIYGTCWETKEELDNYLKLLIDRKERDHRKIGKDLEIFTFHNLTGQGFPIFLENGIILKNIIKDYLREMEKKYGFNEIQTPSFGSIDLYKKSGHLEHYSDTMFKPIKLENSSIIMRPMTCPHHIIVYNMKRYSYRDLPIRFSEHAKLYRNEKSGALYGLERVRSMELTDAHIFTSINSLTFEFENSYRLIEEVLKKFKIKIFYISLSLRDPNNKEKYFNDDKMWNNAENQMRNILKKMKINFKEMIGEAAFYGPKLDIQIKTALGHEITISTLQLDFLLPKKFDAYYIDENEKKINPILIHRGLIGTYERFISILLEQTKGNLPFWLSPKQIVIIPVSLEKHLSFSKEISSQLTQWGYRVYIDDTNERIGKKIRNAQIKKIKFQIVIGDNELKNKNITIRKYAEEEQKTMTIDNFHNMNKD